jgi:hypothetical protein
MLLNRLNNPRSRAAGAVALLVLASPLYADERPQLVPSRDVDITYQVSQPEQRAVRQRVRWLASEGLERIDGSDKSVTIIDRKGGEVTLLTPRTRTFRKLAGTSRQPMEPDQDAVLRRGGETTVAGQHCTEWSWVDDGETHTLCATADGVALRLVVGGKTVIEARSVNYRPQPAELFKVPPGYAPALAPEGGAAIPEAPRFADSPAASEFPV